MGMVLQRRNQMHSSESVSPITSGNLQFLTYAYVKSIKTFYMKKKLKKYQVGLNSDVLAVSFVTEPAIEELFVAMNEDKEDMVYLSTNEKHLAYGAVLVPDKEIYRNDKSGEYTITFSKESIEKMSQNYLKFKRQDNVTLQHDEVADNVVLVESWLKADMEKDKSVALGLNPDLPVGTWFAAFKVNDVDVWERVKSGELKGFSVEAILEANELNFNADEPAPTAEPVAEPAPQEPQRDNKSIIDKILALINGGDVKDVVETAKEVEKPTEVAPDVLPVDEPKEEENVLEVKPNTEPHVEDNNDVVPEVNPLEEVVENLKAEIEELKKNNEALINKIGEISKEPSAKPVNTNAGNGGAVVEGINNPAYQNWRDKIRGAM